MHYGVSIWGLAFFLFSGDAFCMNFNSSAEFRSELLVLIFANLQVHYASGMIEFGSTVLPLKLLFLIFLSVIPWSRCVLGYGMSVGHIHT